MKKKIFMLASIGCLMTSVSYTQPLPGNVERHTGFYNHGSIGHDVINSFSQKIFVNSDGVVKINASGGISFFKMYDINGSQTLPKYVIETNGGYTCVSHQTIFQIDLQGNSLWSKEYSHPEESGAYISEIIPSHNGNPIFFAYVPGPEIRYQVFELDAMNGNFIQKSQFVIPNIYPQGYPTNVIQTSNGYKMLLATGVGAFLLIDIDQSLNVTMITRHSPSNLSPKGATPLDFIENEFGEIVVVGTGFNKEDLNVIKLDGSHNVVDRKSYELPFNTDELMYDHWKKHIVETPDLVPYFLGEDYSVVMTSGDQALTISLKIRSTNWPNEKIFIMQIDHAMNATITRIIDFGNDIIDMSIIENHNQEINLFARTNSAGTNGLIDYKLEADFTGCYTDFYYVNEATLFGFAPFPIDYQMEEEELQINENDINENDHPTTTINLCSNMAPVLGEVKPEEQNSLNIFPNPTSGEFSVQLDVNSAYMINVFDLMGKKLLSENVSGFNTIDLSPFENGIYVVEITNQTTGETQTKKIQLAK